MLCIRMSADIASHLRQPSDAVEVAEYYHGHLRLPGYLPPPPAWPLPSRERIAVARNERRAGRRAGGIITCRTQCKVNETAMPFRYLLVAEEGRSPIVGLLGTPVSSWHRRQRLKWRAMAVGRYVCANDRTDNNSKPTSAGVNGLRRYQQINRHLPLSGFHVRGEVRSMSITAVIPKPAQRRVSRRMAPHLTARYVVTA